MSKHETTRQRVLSGTCNANIGFDDLCHLLTRLGFHKRTKASHHIFTKDGIPDIVNLQPRHDGKAKPYQVRQVRGIINRYRL
jgi:hypothetical protein